MRIDRTCVAGLTRSERDELRALTKAVYPPEPAVAASDPPVTWAPTAWSIRVRDDDGRLVSHVGVLTREATVDDVPTMIGGIGGVKTHPEARGRGYAAAAMRAAAAFCTDDLGVAFVLLVCLPPTVPYYERLGWRRFRGTLLALQPGGTISFTTNLPMVLPARAAAPPGGTINLRGHPW